METLNRYPCYHPGNAGPFSRQWSSKSAHGVFLGCGIRISSVPNTNQLPCYPSGNAGPLSRQWSSKSANGGFWARNNRISTVSINNRLWGTGGGTGSDVSTGLTVNDGDVYLGNDKDNMQNLNNRLASYLQKVKKLELENRELETKIREAKKKQVSSGADYSHYYATIADLREKIFEMTSAKKQISIQHNNARIEEEKLQTKFEKEVGMRQVVDDDVACLKRMLDENNVLQLNLENDIEYLQEELVNLQKNHAADVLELRNQISKATVNVEVDGGQGEDLGAIMEDMRAKYEKMALKNQEELKIWHESKIEKVQAQVAENIQALNEAHATVSQLKRTMQSLQIELQSQNSMKASLEGTLCDVEMRNNMEMERHNNIIRQLEAELTQILSKIKTKDQECVRLEAEIAEYRRLLGEDTIVKVPVKVPVEVPVERTPTKTYQTRIVTETLVDGKVVTQETKVLTSE
ncbi:hypothetical protein UPYG_G00004450 [Umbra pygmaea]|uniref:IF rod domain-containing protein n=1 Tax=Umbra pygmaea TaxID=75934 RepID=A0ABD0XHD0_UMBPY